jgi:putative oxidoreductase
MLREIHVRTSMTTLTALSPWALAALRIMSALLFVVHGTQKLFGWPPGERGQVELASLMGVGGVLEAFGGALLALGLFTRPVAFVLSGMMAVAYFMFHAPQGFYPANNGGDAAILFCFIFLFLFFQGPGRLALDDVFFGGKAKA